MKMSLVKRLALFFIVIFMQNHGMDKAIDSSHLKKDIVILLSDGKISLRKWKVAQSTYLYRYHENCSIETIPYSPHVSMEGMKLFR